MKISYFISHKTWSKILEDATVDADLWRCISLSSDSDPHFFIDERVIKHTGLPLINPNRVSSMAKVYHFTASWSLILINFWLIRITFTLTICAAYALGHYLLVNNNRGNHLLSFCGARLRRWWGINLLPRGKRFSLEKRFSFMCSKIFRFVRRSWVMANLSFKSLRKTIVIRSNPLESLKATI